MDSGECGRKIEVLIFVLVPSLIKLAISELLVGFFNIDTVLMYGSENLLSAPALFLVYDLNEH